MSLHKDLLSHLRICKQAIEEIKTQGENNEWRNTSNPCIVERPEHEILKLSNLIRAHVTKVGILFQPCHLHKDAKVSVETYSKFHDTVILFILVTGQLLALECSLMYCDSVKTVALTVLNASSKLVDEILKLVEESGDLKSNNDFDSIEGTNQRLILVGMVWASCDNIKALMNRGELGELIFKMNSTRQLIDDGFDEFEQWTENPKELVDGFEFDLESGSNSDVECRNDMQVGACSNANNKLKEYGAEIPHQSPPSCPITISIQELAVYSKQCVKKINHIKLLFASFRDLLPKSTPASTVDRIYSSQMAVANCIDKLIVELMINFTVSPTVHAISEQMRHHATTIASLASKAQQDNAKKFRWYTTWMVKYDNTD